MLNVITKNILSNILNRLDSAKVDTINSTVNKNGKMIAAVTIILNGK